MQPVSPERTLYLNAPQTAQRSTGSPQSKAR
jgi:hypothetical protein